MCKTNSIYCTARVATCSVTPPVCMPALQTYPVAVGQQQIPGGMYPASSSQQRWQHSQAQVPREALHVASLSCLLADSGLLCDCLRQEPAKNVRSIGLQRSCSHVSATTTLHTRSSQQGTSDDCAHKIHTRHPPKQKGLELVSAAQPGSTCQKRPRRQRKRPLARCASRSRYLANCALQRKVSNPVLDSKKHIQKQGSRQPFSEILHG